MAFNIHVTSVLIFLSAYKSLYIMEVIMLYYFLIIHSTLAPAVRDIWDISQSIIGRYILIYILIEFRSPQASKMIA